MEGQRTDYGYQLLMLALSVLVLAVLALDVLVKPGPEVRAIIQHADLFVCLVFLYDFFRNLRAAENRWRYFYTWGWLDLLSSIPMVDVLRVGRLARIVRIIRVLRAIRSTRLIANFLLENRAERTFVTTFLVLMVLLLAGSIAVLGFEEEVEANIRTAEDALWWAISTMTTVGYGDKVPLSTEGRIVAALLMVGGVGLFGVLSGLVASWFLQPEQRRRQSEFEALREEIRALRAAVEGSTAGRVASAGGREDGDRVPEAGTLRSL